MATYARFGAMLEARQDVDVGNPEVAGLHHHNLFVPLPMHLCRERTGGQRAVVDKERVTEPSSEKSGQSENVGKGEGRQVHRKPTLSPRLVQRPIRSKSLDSL